MSPVAMVVAPFLFLLGDSRDDALAAGLVASPLNPRLPVCLVVESDAPSADLLRRLAREGHAAMPAHRCTRAGGRVFAAGRHAQLITVEGLHWTAPGRLRMDCSAYFDPKSSHGWSVTLRWTAGRWEADGWVHTWISAAPAPSAHVRSGRTG